MKRSFINSFLIIMILASLFASGIKVEPVKALGALQWIEISSPQTNAELAGVWGADSTHVFVVGKTWTGLLESAAIPLVYRGSGSTWSAADTPPRPAGFTSGGLEAVWGFNASDVYAVGSGATAAGTRPMASHWNGTSWTSSEVPLPSSPTGLVWGYLYSVRGRGSDIYAVGYAGGESVTVPMVSHWNSISGWSSISLPLPTGSVHGYLYGVWDTGTKFYAVGYADNMNPPLLYTSPDGTTWTRSSLTLPAGWTLGYLYGVWGSGSSDVYLAGVGSKTSGTAPLLYHSTDGTNFAEASPQLPSNWTAGELSSIEGTSTTDVYAVGNGTGGDTRPLMYRKTATAWAASSILPVNWTLGYFKDVWGSGVDDVYAVGWGLKADNTHAPLLTHAGQDSIAPGAVTNLAATPGSSNGSVDLSWTAPADDASNPASGPVDHYKVIYSQSALTNCSSGTEATNPPTPATPGTTQTMTISGLTPGQLYNLSICTWDEENNPTGGAFATPVSTTPATTSPGIYDDSDSRWVYSGTWTTYSGSGPYNNTLHYTTIATNTASFSFSGTRFALLFTKNSSRGSFEVWLDDTTYVTTINAYSATTLWQQKYNSPTYSNAIHKVTVKNVSTGGKIVDIDAIQILPPPPPPVPVGTYDDTNSNWIYSSGWTTYSGSGPYNSTLHYTTTTGDTADLWFSGVRFVLTFTKNSSRGSFEVWLDDATLITTINAYSATTLWQQTYTSPTYTNGTHKVTIKNVSTGGKVADVDAIQIFNTPPPPPSAGTYDDTDSNWVYSSGWTTYSGSGPYNSTLHYTATNGSTADFQFSGVGFILTFTKNSNRGNFEVWLDDVTLVTTINAYSATLLWQQKYASPTYTNGTHKVTIKNVNTGGQVVDVDAIQIVPPPPPPVPVGTYDDTDSNWVYSSGWTTYSGSGPYNSTLHYTTTTGDTADLWFSGVRFVLTFTKNSNRGTFEVWLDDVTLVTTINAYSATLLWQQTYTSPTYTNGTHKVTIKNVNTGGQVVDVDAIQIFNTPPPPPSAGTYDDTDSNWVYSSGWTTYSGSGPYSNSLHYTATNGSTADFQFSGVRFVLTFTKNSNRGNFEVWLDDVTLVTTINAYSATLLWQQTYTSPTYTNGTHKVTIKNVNTGGQVVDVDAIQIFNTPPPSTGTYDDTDSNWVYSSGWTTYSGSGPYSNSLHYTATNGSTANFQFSGVGFILTFTKNSNRGTFEVWLDDVTLVTTINAYSATLLWQQTYTSPTYTNGTHKVTIKNVNTGGQVVDVDAIQIP